VIKLSRLLIDPWVKHPNSIGMSYREHLCYAFQTSILLIKTGVFLFIHSVFPFLFENTASSNLYRIIDEMENRKYRRRIFEEGS